ncbi:MAG TPA: ATP-binding protein [Phycisphaerales bacterium]|nr:ATP-binding protein [Phycisphaerales bacterium]
MRPAWRDIAAPLSAVALASLAATVAAALPFLPWGLMLIAAGMTAGIAIVLTAAANRSARIARVNVEARRLLSPEHRAPREAADTLGRPESDAGDDDVSRLRQTLSQLGARMSLQVKEVAKKTRNLETLLDAIQDPLVVTDANDEVLLANRAMLRFAGIAEVGAAGAGGGGSGGAGGMAVLAGRPIRGLFTRPEVLAVHARAKTGRISHARAAMTTEDGPRIFDVAAKPLPAAWGDGVFGVMLILRDITELAQNVQVQKDFVANASHELRTPIAAIRMAAETLDNGAADEPAMRTRLLKTIADHVDRLEETIRDLMDLSRTDAAALTATLAPTDLLGVVESLRATFDPIMAERHVTLSLEIDERARRTHSDARLLSLIFRNLIENAAKHAKPQTTVRVTAQRLPDSRVRIEVVDKGTGIPLAHQERVWERFYQVDPARTGVTGRRGTGLGLAIVKQAVAALKGDCGLESVWGEGTTVWVELPEQQERSERP